MANELLVNIQNKAVSSKGITLMIFDEPWLFQSIKWKQKKEGSKLKEANANTPNGRTEGDYEVENSELVMSIEVGDRLRDKAHSAAVSAGLKGWADIDFPMLLTYPKRGGGEHKVEFFGVRISEKGVDAGNNPDPLTTAFTLSIMALVEDGKPMTDLKV